MKHTIEHHEVIDGILYTNLTHEYIKEVIDFYFDVFLNDEPSAKSMGGVNSRDPMMIRQLKDFIEDGLSLIAIDVSRNKKLIGIRISRAGTF